MKLTLHLFFLVLALAFFCCAAFGVRGNVSWRDLGYACVVAAWLAASYQ